jgi:hypothetical protein
MPKIQEAAMQVYLSCCIPGNTREDKKTTDEIVKLKSLGSKAGKWLNHLYPNEKYEPIKQLVGYVRTWHYQRTFELPKVVATDAEDDAAMNGTNPEAEKTEKVKGWRILPAEMYFDYMERMRERKGKFEALKREFQDNWDEIVAWAKNEHNGTFNPQNYILEKVMKKFSFRVDFEPIPSGQDFKVVLNSEEQAEIQAQIEARAQMVAGHTTRQLWKRLIKPVSHMADVLKDPDKIFRDTLIENIKEIIDIAPKLNITGDSEIVKVCEEIKQNLVNVSAETLRENKEARAELQAQAKAIYDRMAAYGM